MTTTQINGTPRSETVKKTETVDRLALLDWLRPHCLPDRVSVMYEKRDGQGPGWTNNRDDSDRALTAWQLGELSREVFKSLTEDGTSYIMRQCSRCGIVLHRDGLVLRFCIDLDAHEGGIDNTHMADQLDEFFGAKAVRFTSKGGKGLHLFYTLREPVPVLDFVAWAKSWDFNSEGQPECFPKTAKLSQCWLPNEPNENGGDKYLCGDFESCVVNSLPIPPEPPKTEPKEYRAPVHGDDDKPGTAFAKSNTPWSDILVDAVCLRDSNGRLQWRRPNKSDAGISGTTGHCVSQDGRDRLYVFSNGWFPFKQNQCYDRFAALAMLQYGGDFSAAAKALAAQGWGKQAVVPSRINGNGKHHLAPVDDYHHEDQEMPPPDLPPQGDEPPRPKIVCFADVEAKEVEWLWPGRIALGKATGLCGNPGDGKSLFTCYVAAAVSRGLPWPDGSGNAPLGSVIIMNAEDDIEDTIRPRLDAAGADVRKIFALQGAEFKTKDGRKCEQAITLGDIDIIKQATDGIPDLRVIIMDPVTCFLGDADSHKNAEVRAALVPLFELGIQRKIAILMVSHLNKSSGAAMYRMMGSLAFVAAARAAFVITKDKDDSEGNRRLFLPLKNNIGNDKTGLAYAIRPAGKVAAITWEDATVHTSADEALSANGTSENVEMSARDRRRQRTEAGWTDEVLRAVDALVPGSPDGFVKYIEAKTASGLNTTAMDRAVFLLQESGIIEVVKEEYEIANGGKKERKRLRRLCGGSYKPGNFERGF